MMMFTEIDQSVTNEQLESDLNSRGCKHGSAFLEVAVRSYSRQMKLSDFYFNSIGHHLK